MFHGIMKDGVLYLHRTSYCSQFIMRLLNVVLFDTTDNELAVASWKQILRGMVQKGKSAISIMSDDSIATVDTQTSAGTAKTYRSSTRTCPFYKKIPGNTNEIYIWIKGMGTPHILSQVYCPIS